jgi:hypothetical protein
MVRDEVLLAIWRDLVHPLLPLFLGPLVMTTTAEMGFLALQAAEFSHAQPLPGEAFSRKRQPFEGNFGGQERKMFVGLA